MKYLFKFILSCTVFFRVELWAECPCDSFVQDVIALAKQRDLTEASLSWIRFNDCISCRKNIGFSYHYCNRILPVKFGFTQKYGTVYSGNLLYNFLKGQCKDTSDKSFSEEIFDIERHTNGKALLYGGIAMLSGGVLVATCIPAVYHWNPDFLSDPILTIISIFAKIIVPVAGIGLPCGGLTMIIIGVKKKDTYEQFIDDRRLFEEQHRQVFIQLKTEF